MKNSDGVDHIIAEHQSYIDDLKKGNAEALKQGLYNALEKRIQGIPQVMDGIKHQSVSSVENARLSVRSIFT